MGDGWNTGDNSFEINLYDYDKNSTIKYYCQIKINVQADGTGKPTIKSINYRNKSDITIRKAEIARAQIELKAHPENLMEDEIEPPKVELK